MSGGAFIAQPWVQAGLQFLLVDDESRVRELEGKSSAAASGVKNISLRPPAGENRLAASSSDRGAGLHGAAQTAQRASRQSGASQPSAGGAEARELPFEQWGENWQNLWKRLNMPPHPVVLWSYAALGQDLAQKADPARRKVLGRMLAELRHPKGTHVFWPYELPGEGMRPDIFWSGVSLLSPRALLILGSDARDSLGLPKSLRPFCQERVRGRMVIQLHRPENLAANDTAFRSSVVFLSQILHFCSGRLPAGGF